MRRSLWLWTAAAAACGPTVTADQVGGSEPGGAAVDSAPAPGSPLPGSGVGVGAAGSSESCDKIDALFVIDNSGSMAEEQDNLARNVPQFISVLDGYRTSSGTSLDYRVGVTTTGRDVTMVVEFPSLPPVRETNLGDNGALLMGNRCGMQRRWIARGDALVAQTFSCVARVGTHGPAVEMPLYALELALTERVSDGTNAGFLRDDALLAVVVLTDEDDCSRTDDNFDGLIDPCNPPPPQLLGPDRLIAVLDQVKGDRGRWAAAVIAGPGPGRCSSAFGEADEARRLKEFVDRTGANAVVSSICNGDLSGAIHEALATFDRACSTFPPVD
jgi:hypothetical protein